MRPRDYGNKLKGRRLKSKSKARKAAPELGPGKSSPGPTGSRERMPAAGGGDSGGAARPSREAPARDSSRGYGPVKARGAEGSTKRPQNASRAGAPTAEKGRRAASQPGRDSGGSGKRGIGSSPERGSAIPPKRGSKRPAIQEAGAPPYGKSAPRPERAPQGGPPSFAGPKKTLDRILSKAGLGSRTEAEEWIKDGRVKVNGQVAKSIEMWVDVKRDKVTLDGAPVREGPKLYILLYKPKGYITTYKDPEGRPTVYQLLKGVPGFVGTAGRLDMDTSGLLILTNDNAFADFVTSPVSHVPKTYLVKSSTRLTDEQLDSLRKGLNLEDGPTRPAIVTRLRESDKYTHFEITITEGRNRQVRRMVEAIGSKVLKLVRVRIGGLSIDGLQIGAWRELTPAEVRGLIAVRPAETRGSAEPQ